MMQQDKVKVYVLNPTDIRGCYKVIDDELEILQSIVDGYIEFITLKVNKDGSRLGLILNEDGKYREDLLPNCFLIDKEISEKPIDILIGTLIFTRVDEEGYSRDITEEDMKEMRKHLQRIIPTMQI